MQSNEDWFCFEDGAAISMGVGRGRGTGGVLPWIFTHDISVRVFQQALDF